MKIIIKISMLIIGMVLLIIGTAVGILDGASKIEFLQSLSVAITGVLILISLYVWDTVELNRKKKIQKSNVEFEKNNIKININGNEYKIPREKSEFDKIMEEMRKTK